MQHTDKLDEAYGLLIILKENSFEHGVDLKKVEEIGYGCDMSIQIENPRALKNLINYIPTEVCNERCEVVFSIGKKKYAKSWVEFLNFFGIKKEDLE